MSREAISEQSLVREGAGYDEVFQTGQEPEEGHSWSSKRETCKVEFNQPFYWLYSVPNLLVFQHLVTLYLGGLVVKVVSEIE